MRVPPDFIYTLPPYLIFPLVLATVGAVAFLVQVLIRMPRARKASNDLSKISTAVVTVSGAIFGLSMSFLANSVWNSEDQARETVNAEARAIRVMDIYLDSLTEPTREGLSRLLVDYGRAVAAEWDDMADSDAEGGPAELALRDVYAAVIRGFAEGDLNRMVQQRLLGSLDSVSTARQQRLSIAQNYVSVSQWTLVTGLALVLLFTLSASHAAFPLARQISVTAITLAISIMLFVILLHDRPFIGYAALTPDPILAATGAAP